MSRLKINSLDDKLEAVRMYSKLGNFKEVSRRTGISASLIKFWVRLCEDNGPTSLISLQENRKYTPEMKISCVEEMKAKKLSLMEASVAFGIPKKTLHCWSQRVKEGGYSSLFEHINKETILMGTPKKKKKGEPLTELEQLREENMLLRAELDLIKKVDALVAKRCKPTIKSGHKPSRD